MLEQAHQFEGLVAYLKGHGKVEEGGNLRS